MSYYWSHDTGGKLHNTSAFTTTLNYASSGGATTACWIKAAGGVDWPAYSVPSILANGTSSWVDFVQQQLFDTDGRFRTLRGGTTNAGIDYSAGSTYTNTWVAFVTRHRLSASTPDAELFVGSYTNTASQDFVSTTEPTAVLQYLALGNYHHSGGSSPNMCYIGEYAAWAGYMSQADIEAYIAGTSADQINAANLICYYPLKDNGDLTDHSGNGNPTLTVTQANSSPNWSADHPTINYGGTATPVTYVVTY